MTLMSFLVLLARSNSEMLSLLCSSLMRGKPSGVIIVTRISSIFLVVSFMGLFAGNRSLSVY